MLKGLLLERNVSRALHAAHKRTEFDQFTLLVAVDAGRTQRRYIRFVTLRCSD
jgi:hypothetical protein